jgi:peroxiredoxin
MTYTKPIQTGQRLPDLPLVSSRGDEISLASMRGEATLLIFLRHLG